MSSNNARDIIFYSIKDGINDGKDFFVVNADFTGRPFIDIAKQWPERLIQVGIAEQNMISIACGLALAGKKVFTFSPNPFLYLRAYDQIRNALCAMDLSITIVGNGMGFVNPGLGITHFPTEDYQLFSLCPNMNIFSVSDETVAKEAANFVINESTGPNYIRIDYECDGIVPSQETVNIEKGFRIIKQGQGTLIITQGYLTRIVDNLSFSSKPTIIDLFKTPYDKEMLLSEMKKYEKVIVCEEQQLRGGIGSEILEFLNDNDIFLPILRRGVQYHKILPHTFGSREYWMKKFGVAVDDIKKTVEE
ncbi:MAG: hypothetical protein LBE13_05275 [Bacteroidales bacterium]|jgi:transketolase|nr:hypothetical protein [Bacteroidales bacterium]